MKHVLCDLCGWTWLRFEEIPEEDCPICPDSRWGFTYRSDEKLQEEVQLLTY